MTISAFVISILALGLGVLNLRMQHMQALHEEDRRIWGNLGLHDRIRNHEHQSQPDDPDPRGKSPEEDNA